jgi:hypothetical protein
MYILFIFMFNAKTLQTIYCLKNLSHVTKTYVIIACAQNIESEVIRESD